MEDPITHKWNWNLNDPKNVWGPVGWKWIHRLCINYPLVVKGHTRDAFISAVWGFITQLPCLECRSHASTYIMNNPPDMTSRYSLESWCFNFHNAVNERLHKKIITFDEYQEIYAEDIRLAKIN
jgi:hypothetical protein